MHKGARRHGRLPKGVTLLLKATLPTCAPNRRGLSLLQHTPRSSPAARGLGPTRHANRLRVEEAKPPCAVRMTAQRLQVTLHFCPDQRAKGAGSHAGGMQQRQVGALLRLPTRPAWRPRPTHHATGTPDASCMQLHRHWRHHRVSSTVEPIPRLEATQRTTQQRQPSAAVSAAKNGLAAMTMAGGQEQQSRRQLSSRPIRGQRENPLSRREGNAPVSRPRTARACATAAPPTTRPVALTPRRDRRRLWQEKQATLRVRHNNRLKKGTPRRSISYPFPFSSFSLLQQGPGKGDTPKRILPREGTRLRASLLIRGSKAGPPEGFDSRLRLRGPYPHYWSEVRRLAPRKGSTAASGYSGSAPITDQGFEGWPPKGSQPPQTPSEG
jgi:hypothetical protein